MRHLSVEYVFEGGSVDILAAAVTLKENFVQCLLNDVSLNV